MHLDRLHSGTWAWNQILSRGALRGTIKLQSLTFFLSAPSCRRLSQDYTRSLSTMSKYQAQLWSHLPWTALSKVLTQIQVSPCLSVGLEHVFSLVPTLGPKTWTRRPRRRRPRKPASFIQLHTSISQSTKYRSNHSIWSSREGRFFYEQYWAQEEIRP